MRGEAILGTLGDFESLVKPKPKIIFVSVQFPPHWGTIIF
jgi:hypothetical protein